MKTVMRKVQVNRGKLRIWLQGAILEEAGLHSRVHYSYKIEPDRIVIKPDPEGKKFVAGKDMPKKDNPGYRQPIIDFNDRAIEAFLGSPQNLKCTEIQVTASKNKLVIVRGD